MHRALFDGGGRESIMSLLFCFDSNTLTKLSKCLVICHSEEVGTINNVQIKTVQVRAAHSVEVRTESSVQVRTVHSVQVRTARSVQVRVAHSVHVRT